MAIPIVVDDREQKSPVVCALAEHEDVQLSIRRLSVGDYLVNEHLLFERKTLPDLMQSIIDGRLFRQAIRLVSSDFSPVLVLEGTHYDPDSPAVSREAVQGASDQYQSYSGHTGVEILEQPRNGLAYALCRQAGAAYCRGRGTAPGISAERTEKKAAVHPAGPSGNRQGQGRTAP